MAKILINDGLHPSGVKMLENAGYSVVLQKIPQEELKDRLPNFDGICVRSATKVRQELIDCCPNLKLIGRGGVGLDNIDVDYARSKGIAVLNTPAASSRSVAELVFGHAISAARSLHLSNREMPTKGNSEFGALKKSYSKGVELEGKTMGIIGIGRIGQATAKIAFGMGMKVIANDPFVSGDVHIDVEIGGQKLSIPVKMVSREELLAIADFISLHVPFTGSPILGEAEFSQMKDGVIIVDAARGGTIDEDALLKALDSGRVARAALDVFVGEPSPNPVLLNHPQISVSPHIGASTLEAQEKIGTELAQKIIDTLS